MIATFPVARVGPPAWRSGLFENATNIVAHVIYGIAVQFLVEEPPRQGGRGRTSDRQRHAARVG